jgi:Ni/Fe-hydrogenase subunit HybB-like protein
VAAVNAKTSRDLLFVLVLFGLVAAAIRLAEGLGATTGLTDEVPWGLWKVVNMVAGVAIATGGFVMAFAVHVLHIESLKPLLRPALLTAFLGYGSSCAALLFDIGLPHRFWHPIFYWNVHSFLFEVFWCVLLYFTITALEVSPIALEGSKFRKALGFLRKIGGPVMIVGITLSTLHHTSLGSLFLVSPTRLHPLWYTPWLPVLFILSAVGAGMLMVVLLTLAAARIRHQPAPIVALSKAAAAAAVILGLYLVTRVADLVNRGALGYLVSGQWEGRVLIVELLALGVVPLAILVVPRLRRSTKALAAAGICAVAGVVLYRVDVGILGYLSSGATTYRPTLAEIAVTLGIPAAAALAFLWFVTRFKVFTFDQRPAAPRSVTSFEPMTRVWSDVFLDNTDRLSLIAVVVIPLALVLFVPGLGAAETPAAVEAPRGMDEARAVLSIDGDRDGRAVLFPHADHEDRLGGEASCGQCHHLDRPGDRFTSCHHCHAAMEGSASIFDHRAHVASVAAREGFTGSLAGNRSCAICHTGDEPKSGDDAKACTSCHREDMRMEEEPTSRLATGYARALHASCAGCHDEKAQEVGRPDLGDCDTCHPEE